MTVFAPSDFCSVIVPADDEHRGCGRPHVRDVGPDQAWGLSCASGCEEWLLAHDDRWVKDVMDIKPTFDEEKAAKRLELTGAKDQAALMTAALAQIAGFSTTQLPVSVQRMIAGVRPHVPLAGQMVCPGCGQSSPAGQKFCGQCGAKMSVPAAAASITAGLSGMTTDDAIALLLGGTGCTGCGAAVTPGEPCPSCGAIPAMTGPELREALAGSPLAVAAVEAAQAVADGYALIDQAIDKIHDADRIRRVAILRLRRDEAQEALASHQAERAKLYGPRTAARKAEEKVAAELANAQAEHAEIARAEEVARRYKAGVKAEADAAIMLAEATRALSRYQAEHSAAAARLRAADDAVAQSAARGAELEVARDNAVAALADPGRIPYGAEALHAGLMRLILGGRLDDAEMLIAGAFGQWVCAVTGAADAMAATARSELLAEQEEAAKGKALHLRNTRDGGVLAMPNPHDPNVPQAFHPAQYPQHQVQPATTPGWAT